MLHSHRLLWESTAATAFEARVTVQTEASHVSITVNIGGTRFMDMARTQKDRDKMGQCYALHISRATATEFVVSDESCTQKISVPIWHFERG